LIRNQDQSTESRPLSNAQELQKRKRFIAALLVPKALSLHLPSCAQAIEAKKERESKGKQQQGGKGVKDRVGPQQEKGIWLTLVDHLQRQDKLPVVAFTLSRNRCDQVSVVPSEFFCGISLFSTRSSSNVVR
jgi:superfamily II RNA helicase